MPDYPPWQRAIQNILATIIEELDNNEDHCWQLIESMPGALIIVNQSGEISYVNQRIEDLFGYLPSEIIGQSIDILIPENFHHRHSSHLSSYFANPKNRAMGQAIDLLARRKDKSIFPVEIGLGYLNTYNEAKAIAFVVDITERKKIEEALLESEGLLKKAQEIAHVGSWEVNLATNEVIWSDEFFRIVGLEPHSITATIEAARTMIHPDDRERATLAFIEARDTGKAYDIEQRISRTKGELRWVASQGEIATDSMTGIRRLLGVFIDITDRKLAQERELDLSLERERLQLLTQFIQNVSHEFRTPLTVISSSVYLMKQSADPELRLRKAEIIQEQIASTSRLIDMLMMTVELQTVQELSKQTIKISTIVESVYKSINILYKDKLSCIYEKPNHILLIQGHDSYLLTAIQQIANNACRVTPQGGTFTLTLSQEGDYARVICQDSGIGIAKEDLPHIFESFWRKDVAHSTPGFGLGLPIAKKIIEMHDGTITVKSVVGEGTSVQIDLPLYHPEASNS